MDVSTIQKNVKWSGHLWGMNSEVYPLNSNFWKVNLRNVKSIHGGFSYKFTYLLISFRLVRFPIGHYPETVVEETKITRSPEKGSSSFKYTVGSQVKLINFKFYSLFFQTLPLRLSGTSFFRGRPRRHWVPVLS